MPHPEKTITNFAIELTISLLAALSMSCSRQVAQDVRTAGDGNILKNGRSEYFIGTNLWYAGRLAKTEEGMARLDRELDTLKSLGVTNLRVLATEGEDVAALRSALDRMHEKGMCAVLFLNNAWEWSYGFADYLEVAGEGTQPRPATDGYPAYMKAMAAFCASEKAVALNHDYIRAIVSELKDHPAIFSWQISNEPRCFSNDSAVRDAFVKYIHGTAALIKSLDPAHMVSTGNEGLKGCEEDNSLYEKINDCKDIDYITIHIWPYNWGWVKEDSVTDGISAAVEQTGAYIDEHLDLARRLGHALIIEEFCYPRSDFRFDRGCPTEGRDRIYSFVFSRVVESAENGGNLAGCNFWGWGGFAQPAHEMWQEGDDLCGDPAQEAQGLTSVFA
ncbi:MAG: beta-galactosidase, partial [Bacteroidales bacterium]|nr:beta-galactosidase [Bacteroidales bacterium]